MEVWQGIGGSRTMSFASLKDGASSLRHFTLTPPPDREVGYWSVDNPALPKQTGTRKAYSITSSARTNTAGGIATPRVRATLLLIAISKRVSCSKGISAGLLPDKMRTAASGRSLFP
jgi:hypothetical protein